MALGVALIVLVPLAIGFYAMSRHHFAQAVAAQQRASELQARLLEAALRHVMLEQDSALLGTVLQEIGANSAVRKAVILDHKGTIKVASDRSLVGRRIPVHSAECSVCHAKDPGARGRWTLLERGEETILRSVLPIENRAECHACHGSTEKLNGMLVLDTSMSELEAELRSDTGWFVAGAAVLAVLLLGGIGVLVRFLMLGRLAKLARTARAIAAGNLSKRASVKGDDVIAALAVDFNDMADNVARLVGEVRDRETRLQSVMNSLDDGLVVLDEGSRIIACNQSFGRRLGRLPETVQGSPCATACGGLLPCCKDASQCPAALCRTTGEVQRAVFQSRSDDGETASVDEVYASPVFDAEGRVARVVEVWRDITTRVKEEQRMAEIERLVSLGTLASGFSHEVNTPLASMLTCAESVLGRLDGVTDAQSAAAVVPAIRDHAEIIRGQVLRCRRITEQFLRFSRGIPPSIEPIDLAGVVTSVIALVAPTAREKGIVLRQLTDGPLPAVRANTEVVQHTVLNLLLNAVQSFEGKKGSVEVSFRRDDGLRLCVRDEGCGIDPARRAHLFEPFRTGKPGGTGLGLFLSRSFMRRFGGDVRLVDSRVGVGSCFEVVFSVASESAP